MSEAPDQSQPQYIGRFAPSPTGRLHFGSLVAALASFLDARHHGGRWLVRVEDLDPPREQVGAAKAILKCLESHQLCWDGEVLYQSQRHDAYAATLAGLQQRGLIYPCYCTRKTLATIGGPYPGTCRHRPFRDKPKALRLHTEELPVGERRLQSHNTFDDVLLGPVHCENPLGDFIVRRKDGLYAYQLAVVVDDIFQGISHVIRGVDLLDSTPAQRFLFHYLGQQPPQFGHIALALNTGGQKLSKQHGAKPVANRDSRHNILAALRFLNHDPGNELAGADLNSLLSWAIANWNRKKLPEHDKTIIELDS